MSLKMQSVKVNGSEFQFHPISLLETLKLDKKVISLFSGADPAEMHRNPAGVFAAMVGGITDEDLEYIVRLILPKVVAVRDGFPPTELDTPENQNAVFGGNLPLLYSTIYAYLQYLKLTIFTIAPTSPQT